MYKIKGIVFDTGPIISLTINNLVWLLEPLKKKFKGNFYITSGVYEELIERPLKTKKYKFEALQVLPYITRGIITKIQTEEITKKAEELLDLMNKCFYVDDTPMKIVQVGEIEAIVCAKVLGINTIVVDERTTRNFIEDPLAIRKLLQKKLHRNVQINKNNLKLVRKELEGLHVIRSFELVIIAYELGLLNRYILDEEREIIDNLDEAVLEGVLWGIKLNGCSMRESDIKQVIELLRKK